MHSVQFTAQSSSDDIVERDFAVGDIPGVLWSPQTGSRRAPLVLTGHGGGTHKKWPGMVGRAHRLVTAGGFHVAVIDAPGHGERPRTPTDEREVAVPPAGRRNPYAEGADRIRPPRVKLHPDGRRRREHRWPRRSSAARRASGARARS